MHLYLPAQDSCVQEFDHDTYKTHVQMQMRKKSKAEMHVMIYLWY